MYEIIFTHRAIKDLEKLEKEVKNQIAIKLKEFSIDPFRNSRKLINPKIGSYRFKIGNYRVIFDIEDNHLIILRIGHRKDIYK
ncbi:type II toxin-antitoxin system RelE family toxin [Thermodesulfovibrio sp. TK110]